MNLNTLKDFGERLKSARKGKLTQEDLSEATGISQNAICNYENGKRRPNAPRIQSICAALGISPSWLLTGEGPMAPEEQLPGLEEEPLRPYAPAAAAFALDSSKDGKGMINVPRVASALPKGRSSFDMQMDGAGYWAFASDFLLRKGDPESMVVMQAQGDSMEPEIMDGDMVLIDQSKRAVRLGRIYAVAFEDVIYLKRIDKEPGRIILKSVNPDYQPIALDLRERIVDKFRIIGQVLWVGREYQE